MDKLIQIVEDDPNIRFIVEYILKDAHYKVESFCNAKTFNNREMKENADLVILDVMLPDGNGIALCKALKSDEMTSNIPVIIMSAHCSSAIAYNEGQANLFIQKPFDLDFLISKVGEIVDCYR